MLKLPKFENDAAKPKYETAKFKTVRIVKTGHNKTELVNLTHSNRLISKFTSKVRSADVRQIRQGCEFR